jgi:hypothetical protein
MFIADLAVPSVPYHPAQNPASPQPEARHPNLVVPAREGIVADGYIFSTEPLPVTVNEQVIPLQSGEIAIDLTGRGTMKQGDMVITAGTHISSAKTLGDQAGHKYGSVTGTYDAGPAGLGRAGHGGGLYSDGRPRLSFGNDRK